MNEENKTIIKALNMYGRVPEQWELLKEIEKLQQENKQLKENYQFITQENERLSNLWCNNQHIVNELEEWTKSEYDRYYNDKENLVFSNVEVIDFGRVLDKIQELKEKYK